MKYGFIIRNTLLFVSFITLSAAAFGDTTEALQTTQSQLSFDYFNIQKTSHNVETGLLGTHYTLHLFSIPDLYTGFGLYSAITGQNGGLFVLGVENNYTPQLYKSLYLDSGLFIGGGGAHSAKVGGGLMLLPHLGLSYALKHEKLNIDYGYVVFPYGDIKASEILFGISFLNTFDFFTPTTEQPNDTPFHITHNSWYLSPLIQTYQAKNNTEKNHFGLIGAEIGKYTSKNLFFALRTTAIAAGKTGNGYMSVMGGVGYQYPLSSRWYSIADLFLGAGGGGQINTGNGMQYEADTGIGFSFSKKLDARLYYGYLAAPDGNFNALVGSAALRYYFDWMSITPENPNDLIQLNSKKIQHWRAGLFSDTYLHPKRTDNRSDNVSFIHLELEQQFNAHWYMDYRSTFAYNGNQSGGAATGQIGPGYQFLPHKRIHPHAEFLLGAIGGGGFQSEGGLYATPEMGLRFDLSSCFGVDARVGQAISVKGKLNATVFSVGGIFSFGKMK